MKRTALLILSLLSFANATIMDTAKERTTELYGSVIKSFITEPLTEEEQREKFHQEWFSSIWNDVYDNFEDASELERQLDKAPDSAWLTKDKVDINDDIDELINKIVKVISEDNLLEYKEKIALHKEKIEEMKKTIIGYREQKVGAPVDSSILTTKSDYDGKIIKLKDEINRSKNEIRIVKKTLKRSFLDIGIILSDEQIEALLIKIYGDDIIRMNLAMNTLKQITNQIMELLKESKEELNQAKKYYGMNIVALKIQILIQNKYINKINNRYIPQLDNIIHKSKIIIKKTQIQIENEKDDRRKSVYMKNEDAQIFTFQIANFYKEDLLNFRNILVNAKNISHKNLELAINTYRTVDLSASLYEVMEESSKMMSEVILEQMPNIIPFENTAVKLKYQEITKKMRQIYN